MCHQKVDFWLGDFEEILPHTTRRVTIQELQEKKKTLSRIPPRTILQAYELILTLPLLFSANRSQPLPDLSKFRRSRMAS